PRFGQLVPHQRELDRQHDGGDTDDHPAQPPVFAPGGPFLAAGVARLRVVGHANRVTVQFARILSLPQARRDRFARFPVPPGAAVTLACIPAAPSIDSVADQSVTPFVRKAAAWAWRLVLIGWAIVALLWAVKKLELLVVPVALATLLAALLLPIVDFLDRRGAPRGGAVALVLLGGFAVVGGIL